MFLIAVALAASAAEPLGTQPKWVPLNPPQSTKLKSQEPRPAPTTAMESVVATPAVTQPPAEAAAASMVAAPQPAAEAVQGRLDLTCFGGGTANKLATTSAFSTGHASGSVGFSSWSGSGSSRTTVYGTRQQGFGDQVDIRLFGGDDRIRMPRTMLPPIRGGKAGWFKLKDVVADARSIRASAAVNFINNPKVFIDRVTGTISISGKAGDFAGQCEVIDASAPAKF